MSVKRIASLLNALTLSSRAEARSPLMGPQSQTASALKRIGWLVACIGLSLVLLGCPTQSRLKSQPLITPAQIEKRLHDLINKERKKRGLSTLQHSPRMQIVARKHSQEMVRTQVFSHINESGEDPIRRGNRAGIRCQRQLPTGVYRTGIAENLFQTYLYSAIIFRTEGNQRTTSYRWLSLDKIAQTAVAGWLNSPSHRKNMLHPQYTHGSLGVSIDKEGKIYITHNLC